MTIIIFEVSNVLSNLSWGETTMKSTVPPSFVGATDRVPRSSLFVRRRSDGQTRLRSESKHHQRRRRRHHSKAAAPRALCSACSLLPGAACVSILDNPSRNPPLRFEASPTVPGAHLKPNADPFGSVSTSPRSFFLTFLAASLSSSLGSERRASCSLGSSLTHGTLRFQVGFCSSPSSSISPSPPRG